jgi:hypothetical protein
MTSPHLFLEAELGLAVDGEVPQSSRLDRLPGPGVAVHDDRDRDDVRAGLAQRLDGRER